MLLDFFKVLLICDAIFMDSRNTRMFMQQWKQIPDIGP